MNKVIVAGSINMDIVAFTKRHPTVGETVFGDDLKYFPGGKGANQAVSASRLGSETIMVGKVGSDSFGDQLITFLEKEGIKNNIYIQENIPTGTAIITVSTETSNNTIVVIPGANFRLTNAEVSKIKINSGDVLVSQFEIPIETIISFFRIGRTIGTINILNPAPAKIISPELMELVDVLILNETELELLSSTPIGAHNVESVSNAVKKISLKNQSIIVTLGENGVLGYVNGETIKVDGRKVVTVDTTGAGDCFVGALASKLASGEPLEDAIRFANIAASICVTKEGAGTSMPTLDEINKIYPLI